MNTCECHPGKGCIPGACVEERQSPLPADSLVERVIGRADEVAIETYNRRLGVLRERGDHEEADLLREGFSYGCNHGRAEALPAMRERDELRAALDVSVEALEAHQEWGAEHDLDREQGASAAMFGVDIKVRRALTAARGVTRA